MSRKSDKKKGWVYIPVEVKVREQLAKTLLGAFAAERGYRVVIGEAHTVRSCLHQMPAGVLLEKGVAPSKRETFAHLKSFGHRVMSWCEEGLVFFEDDDYIRRKVTKADLLEADYFFAWGPYQADLLSRTFPEMGERILQVGNPRMDLLKPEFRSIFDKEAERLQEAYGNFILINTNFSHCNHRKGEDGYFELIEKQGRLSTPEEKEFTRKWLEHKQVLFDAFKEMIPKVGERYPDHCIVVRPHPGENHDTYRELFAGLENVNVVHEGGVMPWLRAAQVLIHNGCFTGIEALLIGCPAIAYRPVRSETYDQYLPNSVNMQAESENALFSSLDQLLLERERDAFVDLPEGHKVLAEHLVHVVGQTSCDAILDRVDSLPHPLPNSGRRPWFYLHHVHLTLYLKLYNLMETLLAGGGDRGDYSRQKYPGLSQEELSDQLDVLKSVTNRFSQVEIRKLGTDLFELVTK